MTTSFLTSRGPYRADAHIHLFRQGFSGTSEPGAEFDRYLALKERFGISEALVIGYEGEPRFVGNNEELLDLAQRHMWMKPTLYFDPQRPPTPDQVHSDRARGAEGYSLYLGTGSGLADLIPDKVWDALSTSRSVVSLNASPEVLDEIRQKVAAADGCRVLISHLCLPGDLRGVTTEQQKLRMAPLLELAEASHVSIKFSGLYAIDPTYPHAAGEWWTLAALSAFGPDRVLWGSDFSPGLDVLDAESLFTVPQWLRSEFDEREWGKVIGMNLRDLLCGGTP